MLTRPARPCRRLPEVSVEIVSVQVRQFAGGALHFEVFLDPAPRISRFVRTRPELVQKAVDVLVVTVNHVEIVVAVIRIGTVRLASYSPEEDTEEYAATRDGDPTVFHVREYVFKRVDKSRADFVSEPTPTVSAQDRVLSAEDSVLSAGD